MFSPFKAFAVAASLIGMIPAGAALAAGQHAGGHGHATSFGEPGTAAQATRTIEITAKDHTFSPPAIQVKAGETVHFVIRNAGEFLHEFNIGTPAMHAEHQKEMAMMMEHGMLTPTGVDHRMANMDHARMGTAMPMKHDDPNSVLIEPGETKELVWTFSRAADLQFACNVPGHYESGMVGAIQFGR